MDFDSAVELTVTERRNIIDAIAEAVFTEPYGRECRLEWSQAVEGLASRDVAIQHLQLAVPHLQAMDPMARVLVAESIRDQRIEGASIRLFAALVADGTRIDQAFAILPSSPSVSGILLRVVEASGELPKGALKRIFREDLSQSQRELAIRMMAGRTMTKIDGVVSLARQITVKQAQAAMAETSSVGTTFTKFVRDLLAAPPMSTDDLIAAVSLKSRGHAQVLRLMVVKQAIPKWKRVIAERLSGIPELGSDVAQRCTEERTSLEQVVVLVAALADNPEYDRNDVVALVGELDATTATNLAAAVTMDHITRLDIAVIAALRDEPLERRATQAFALMAAELEPSRIAGLHDAVSRVPVESTWQYALDLMVRNSETRCRLATELTDRRDRGRPWAVRDIQEFCDAQMRSIRQREQAFSRA